MGCCASTPEDGLAPRPAKRKSPQNTDALPPLSIPDVKWDLDPSWTESIEKLRNSAVASGRQAEFEDLYDNVMLKLARDWLEEEYPECAKAGTIEDMGEVPFPTSYGRCRYPTKSILVLDENFTGVVYTSVLIVAMPVPAS